MTIVKLQIGAGNNPKEGYINQDYRKYEGIDDVFDLNVYPYKYPDNCFDEIFAEDIIEHLDDTIKAIDELWRITKDGGIIKIYVPHFTHWGTFGDLTHKRGFSIFAFDYYMTDYYPCKAKFYSIKRSYVVSKNFKFLNIFNPIFNLSKFLTENFLCKFFLISRIYVELRVRK